MTADGGIFREDRVEAEDEGVTRCFPAWTRRREAGGRDVRRERSWRRVVTVVDEGIERGITGKIFGQSQDSAENLGRAGS